MAPAAGVICILIPEDFSINFWLIFKYANEEYDKVLLRRKCEGIRAGRHIFHKSCVA